MSNTTNEDIDLFKQLIDENRFDLCKLVYIIFPFGQEGHALEHFAPYDWQMEEWAKLSRHLQNPLTRYQTYRLIVSSGNGAAKTAFGAMTFMMLMYTQRVRARITANTQPQLNSIVWPEYDIWFQHARYVHLFFEKFGTSIKARDPKVAETWRLDAVTWNEQSPQSMSGLHNKGGAVLYIFEEAPGIPAVIWQYAAGAFTETGTIKLFLAFGNSDDPESKFEQNMSSPLWHTRRIDTRTLDHIDPQQIADWLMEAGGDEENDDFRVRVRGLPRKSSKDSIIKLEKVEAAILRGKTFDPESVEALPCILMCDPAWTGGDDTTIARSQGQMVQLLDKHKLNKEMGETHMLTYQKLCHYEKKYKADAVFIDQGEGTAIYTLAMNAGKTNWYLVSFASSPTDNIDPKKSEYGNLRAQMYFEADKWLGQGGVIICADPDHEEDVKKQLTWTKASRHKVTQKKMAEPKADIKTRVGQSPDVADVIVMRSAIAVTERLPEHDMSSDGDDRFRIGQGAFKMPDHGNPYDDDILEAQFRELYD
jgi:hypothetical protein